MSSKIFSLLPLATCCSFPIGVQLWLSLLLILLVVCYLIQYLRINRQRLSDEPPIAKHHPIWGNGKEFRTDVVAFLHQCRQQLGDVFSLLLPFNQCIHMIANPCNLSQFSKHASFDFLSIQKTLNWNVFGFTTDSHKHMLSDLNKSAKKAIKSDLFAYCDHLNRSMFKLYKEKEWDSTDFIIHTMFKAIVCSLYGSSKIAGRLGYKTLSVLLKPIHSSLRYKWFGAPSWLFPSTCFAWKTIYEKFPSLLEISKCCNLGGYINSVLKDVVRQCWNFKNFVGHNMVILHVYYNNCKIAFWFLNYLTQFPEQAEQLIEEIDSAVAAGDSDEKVVLSKSVVESLPLLKSFFIETSRLSSGLFIIRKVISDALFETHNGNLFKMRKGDFVSIFQPAFYRDPEIFENPEEFNVERFLSDQFEYQNERLSKPVLPFGILCPAKSLATLQMKLFLLVLLTNFRVVRVGDIAAVPDVGCYGDEILPPTKESANLTIRLSPRRQRFCQIQLDRDS